MTSPTQRAGNRPAVSSPDNPEARKAVAALIASLQQGLDSRDADQYDESFAADIAWGSPFGATVHGFTALNEIHHRLIDAGTGGPSSRYEPLHVAALTDDVVLAQVRRTALDSDGEPMGSGRDGSFSEVALYVLVHRDGSWWLAAGQNTIVA